MTRLLILFLVCEFLSFVANVSASPLGCLMDEFAAHGVPRNVAIDGKEHPLTGVTARNGATLYETLGWVSAGMYGYALYNKDHGGPLFYG